MTRLGLCLPGKVMYIGGSDTLPPPLSRKEAQAWVRALISLSMQQCFSG